MINEQTYSRFPEGHCPVCGPSVTGAVFRAIHPIVAYVHPGLQELHLLDTTSLTGRIKLAWSMLWQRMKGALSVLGPASGRPTLLYGSSILCDSERWSSHRGETSLSSSDELPATELWVSNSVPLPKRRKKAKNSSTPSAASSSTSATKRRLKGLGAWSPAVGRAIASDSPELLNEAMDRLERLNGSSELAPTGPHASSTRTSRKPRRKSK